jgi:hypothetical protein
VQQNCVVPDAEGDGEEPFANLVLDMTDVTPDGGVKKKLIKPGSGCVVPLYSYVTGVTELCGLTTITSLRLLLLLYVYIIFACLIYARACVMFSALLCILK